MFILFYIILFIMFFFIQVDRDRDGLISKEEFVRYTDLDIFNIDEEWKPIRDKDKNEFFTDEVSGSNHSYDHNELKIEAMMLFLLTKDIVAVQN